MSVKEKYGTKVEIKKWDVNWREIKNLCRTTIGMDDSKIEPTDEWKKKLLIAEHSPLRHSLITIDIHNVPFFVMGHLVRHNMGVTPYVRTSRTDRTGVDRSERKQTDVVDMRMDLNIQALINISSKRLCTQADKDTREIWDMVVSEVEKFDPVLAWVCVPQCVKSSGCTEGFGECKYYEKLMGDVDKEILIHPIKRYDEYNAKTRTLKRGK